MLSRLMVLSMTICTVVEIKYPYMGGIPFPYRKVPLLYIPQCQLEMYSTNTQKCHFVCWTPRRTVIFLIKRDEQFIQELLVQLKCFWKQTQIGEVLNWNMNLDFLKTKAQNISDQSILLKTLKSLVEKKMPWNIAISIYSGKKNEVVPKRKCHG